MNMKMYKKPIMEVAAFETERMMDGLTLSPTSGNVGGGGGGSTAMPKRGDYLPD